MFSSLIAAIKLWFAPKRVKLEAALQKAKDELAKLEDSARAEAERAKVKLIAAEQRLEEHLRNSR